MSTWNHVDGRAKLKALAGPLFARMPEGIYREMLADRLAARVSMPANKLKEFFAAGAARAPRRAEIDRNRRAGSTVE